jgi:hypothetical protein
VLYPHFCDEHAPLAYPLLEIRESSLGPGAGYGLFARRDIPGPALALDIVRGQHIPLDEYLARPDLYASNYAWDYIPLSLSSSSASSSFSLFSEKNAVMVDASGTQSCITRYINDPRDPDRVNCVIVPDPEPLAEIYDCLYTHLVLENLRPIRRGEELFIAYGPHFWR